MNRTKCTAAESMKKRPSQITDVGHFFAKITAAYVHFQECVLQLNHTLPNFSSQQILDECEKIRLKRESLAVLDQQMFDIISLVGSEIADEPIVHDYRVAFAGANMACTNLSQNLRALQLVLKEGSSQISL